MDIGAPEREATKIVRKLRDRLVLGESDLLVVGETATRDEIVAKILKEH